MWTLRVNSFLIIIGISIIIIVLWTTRSGTGFFEDVIAELFKFIRKQNNIWRRTTNLKVL